ncbi:MAG: hypothetical protein IPN20_15970 [Haliscomenobacter sp.]|nr:hypothetical protein [Haliscomenobacter sp.]
MLEKTTAETKRGQLSLLLQQNQTDYATAYNSLKTLMNTGEEFTIDNGGNFQPLVLSNSLDTSMIANNAALKVLYQKAVIAEKNKKSRNRINAARF